MSLVNQDIRNFILGVSQQPPTLRSAEQLAEQINGFSSEAAGLLKRPPTIFVKSLMEHTAISTRKRPFIHFINRDKQEKYILVIQDNQIFVFDLSGNSYKVTYEGNSQKYITEIFPRETFKAVTIADYTFILNKSKVIYQDIKSTTGEQWETQGLLVNVKSGQYGRTYRIVVNGETVASYTTPDGSKQEHINNINTDYIAEQLATGATEKGYTVTKGSSWLYLTGIAVKSFDCYDGYNNQALYGTYKTAQKFTNLPSSAPDGFTCRVAGDEGSTTDDYFVKYVAADNVWRECAKPGEVAGLDADSMPHALIRNADGSFTFKAVDWNKRNAGDDDSNPMPSFVGYTANDIFYYKNRLGILSGENVILSASADFFNFFMASAVNVQDTDPIDIAAADNTISKLYHAVPFDEDLILFAENAQFALESDGVLTPKSAYLTPPVTHYACTTDARPVNAGRNVYFCSERLEYTTVHEFYTAQDNTDAKDAQDITAHVPSYIPNTVHAIVACNTENVLLFLSDSLESSVFVYKYLFINGQRQQASWSRWDFDSKVLGGAWIDNKLYLLTLRNKRLTLEYLTFTYATLDFPGEPYRIMMDCKKVYTIPAGAYDAKTNETVIDLQAVYGDAYGTGKTYGVVCNNEYTESAEGYARVYGNCETLSVFVGVPYEFCFVLSPIFVRTQNAQGGTDALLEGRLQMRKIWFNYADSGFFKVNTYVDSKGDYEYRFTGYTIGNRNTTLGSRQLATGKFTIPLQTDAEKLTIKLSSANPEPVGIIGAGWIGNYVRKTRKY